jgi:hypothetical protein
MHSTVMRKCTHNGDLNTRTNFCSAGAPAKLARSGIASRSNPTPAHYPQMRWLPASVAEEDCADRLASFRPVFSRSRDEPLVLAGSLFGLERYGVVRSVAVQQTAGFRHRNCCGLQHSHRRCASRRVRLEFAPEAVGEDALRELGDCAGAVLFADKTTTRVPTFTRL